MDDLLKDLIRAWTEAGFAVAEAARAVGGKARPAQGSSFVGEICRWRKSSSGKWVVVGERETLQQGRVRVQTRSKPEPEITQVENVRMDGGFWVADKVEPARRTPPPSYFVEVPPEGDLPDPLDLAFHEDIPF